MDDRLFDFEKYMKNLSHVHNRIHKIIDDYNPQTKSKYEDKKRAFSILNEVKNSVPDFYFNPETISKLIKSISLQD